MPFKDNKSKHFSKEKIAGMLLCLLLGGLLGTLFYLKMQPSTTTREGPAFGIYFSPKGGCTEAIVKEINSAKEAIYMQVYSFTSKAIGDALIEAEKRGVKLFILADQKQYQANRAAQIDRLKGAYTKRYIGKTSGSTHTKTIVVDGKSFPICSFNFDKNAEKNNRENILYAYQAPEEAQTVIDNCIKNYKRAIPYTTYKKGQYERKGKKGKKGKKNQSKK